MVNGFNHGYRATSEVLFRFGQSALTKQQSVHKELTIQFI